MTGTSATRQLTRYTRNGAGTKKNEGWTREGLEKFNELAKMVKMDRSRSDTTFEAEYMAEKESYTTNKAKRRKKDISDSKQSDRIYTYIEGDDDGDDGSSSGGGMLQQRNNMVREENEYGGQTCWNGDGGCFNKW